MALVDEIYDDYNLNDLFGQTDRYLYFQQLFYAVINGCELSGLKNVELHHYPVDLFFPSTFPGEKMDFFSMFGETRRVYLRSLFRSPWQISKMCTKIRRQLDYCSNETSYISYLPWAMSVDNGLDVNSKNKSISFLSHQNVYFIIINGDSFRGKRVAIVEIEQKVTVFVHSNPSVHLFHVDKLECADAKELEFTGVEFNIVYISFSIIGDDINRIKKVKLILYNAMSCAKDHVIVLFHENDWALFDELYKYTEMDIVLDKLSKSELLGEYDLETIDSQLRLMQVIKSIIVRKHLQQFKAVLPLIRKFKDADFRHCVQTMLASCFTWCKKGNILEMLHLFQSETNTEMTQEDAWNYLCTSILFVAEDWEQTSKKKFFDKFQKVTQVSFKNFEITTNDYSHILFPNCWIAESEDLLQSFKNSVDSDLLRLFEFIVSMGKFKFDKNCFRKIITTLLGERAISIDVERSMSVLCLVIPREENFGIIMNLIENDAVKLFTEFNSGTVDRPLIFTTLTTIVRSAYSKIFSREFVVPRFVSVNYWIKKRKIFYGSLPGEIAGFIKHILSFKKLLSKTMTNWKDFSLKKTKIKRVLWISTFKFPLIQG